MKYCIVYLLGVFGCFSCVGQVKPESAIRAYVNERASPMVLSMQVQASNQQITFSSAEDYAGSKTIPAYYRITVKAPPVPWVVTAMVTEQYLNSKTSSHPDDAASLVTLRDESTGNTIRVSGTPQILLQSSNSLAENEYFIDLVVDPPFDMPAGNILGMLSFQISLQ